MVELSLRVPQNAVEPVSDTLIEEFEALCVSVEDADLESASMLFDEPGISPAEMGWQLSSLKALFNNETVATEAAAMLVARNKPDDIRVLSISVVAERDWLHVVQAQSVPIAITPNFWIVPSWHEPPEAARCVIKLDPGRAFGTGTHPTTRMCLRWIAHHVQAGAVPVGRVLDYGCGSGILAIAAAIFGAGEVDAVDIDADAIEVARANAEENKVLVKATKPEDAQGAYTLVLANILARPLILLAPVLSGLVQLGGSIVLAGILARQAIELQQAYAPWFRLEISDDDDDWILMTGRRTNANMA